MSEVTLSCFCFAMEIIHIWVIEEYDNIFTNQISERIKGKNMANYECVVRTNYFHVTDEGKFRGLLERFLPASCEVFTRVDDKGKNLVAFGSNEEIDWPEDDSTFISGLQECLAENDSIIVLEVGNEKLSYLVGAASIITRSGVETIDLISLAMNKAAEMLGNPNYTTQCEY